MLELPDLRKLREQSLEERSSADLEQVLGLIERERVEPGGVARCENNCLQFDLPSQVKVEASQPENAQHFSG